MDVVLNKAAIEDSVNRPSFILLILFFNIVYALVSIIFQHQLGGLAVGCILSMMLFAIDSKYFFLVDGFFKALLYLNLFILINNLFFSEFFIMISPIFGDEGNYDKVILRVIRLFGYDFRIRRVTGISDNIHVTSLLNLILAFIQYESKKWKQFTISSIVLFCSLNMQFVVIYFVWLFIRKRKIKFNLKTILIVVFLFLLVFYAVDFLILDNAYYNLIAMTGSKLVVGELSFYLDQLTAKSFLFGFKSGEIENPYDASGYRLPLTDIGFFGVPIQYGLFGLVSIILISVFWIQYASGVGRKFILSLFICLVHYFSLASLLGIIFVTWIVKRPRINSDY